MKVPLRVRSSSTDSSTLPPSECPAHQSSSSSGGRSIMYSTSFSDIDVPLFYRRDFRLGECLGKGSFSKVYAITRTRKRGSNLMIMSNKNQQQQDETPIMASSPSKLSNHTESVRNLLLNNKITDDNKDSRFAMKILRQETQRKDEKHIRAAVRDIINEVNLLSKFNHENIIGVYGYSHNSFLTKSDIEKAKSFNHMFLIIDQLDWTLDQEIDHWRMKKDGNKDLCAASKHSTTAKKSSNNNIVSDDRLKHKVDIALQLANAIQYIHQNGCIYRDLKPQNVGFKVNKNKDQIQVKLFDFGVCRELPEPAQYQSHKKQEDQLYKMSFVGSPRYMAPEIHNKELYNRKVDVYSWSLVVYSMFTLSKPYSNLSPGQHRELVCHYGERPSFDPACTGSFEIPSKLQSIIQKAWAHDVVDRSTMLQVTTELRRYYTCEFKNHQTFNEKAALSFAWRKNKFCAAAATTTRVESSTDNHYSSSSDEEDNDDESLISDYGV